MIQEKLLKIQQAVTALKKDAKAYNYDYVSGDKVLSIIRPKMDELGVLLIPNVEDMRVERVDYGNNKTEFLYLLKMRMEWLDTEDNTTLEVEWASSGQNGFDKGFGSALTYGERYFLLKFFHLQTDKDDVDAVNTKRDKEIEADNARMQRNEDIKKWAKAEVAGWVSQQGLTARESFAKNFKPTDEEMQMYLKAVTYYSLQDQAKKK